MGEADKEEEDEEGAAAILAANAFAIVHPHLLLFHHPPHSWILPVLPMSSATVFCAFMVDHGVPAVVTDYLTAKGIVSVQHFSKWVKSEAEVKEKVMDPLASGATVKDHGEFKFHPDDDQDIIEVSVTVAKEAAKSAPPKKPSTVSEGGGTSSRTPDTLATTLQNQVEYGDSNAQRQVLSLLANNPISSSPLNALSKPPKALDRGTYLSLINKFESRWEPPRSFDMKLIYGADQTLARMWHEHYMSRVYSPVPLHEVISSRTYNKRGLINPLKMRNFRERIDEEALQRSVAGATMTLL